MWSAFFNAVPASQETYLKRFLLTFCVELGALLERARVAAQPFVSIRTRGVLTFLGPCLAQLASCAIYGSFDSMRSQARGAGGSSCRGR